MPLHEDTVVSRLPDFEQIQEKKARAGDCEGTVERPARDAPLRSAPRALGGRDMPPLPPGWGKPQPLRVVPPPPAMTNPRPAAARVARAARPAFDPIPEACFEPSVVMAVPQQQLAVARQVAAQVIAEAEPRPAAHGKVIVMFSCRGGAGATTLSVNTAAALARAGNSVCIVDLDLQLGDVFVALDLQAQTSIAALAREASTIDGAALKRRLARHDSGVYALAQAGQVDDVDGQLVERMPALLATLASHFDYVLIDGVRDFDDIALSVLDMADRIAMLLTQDVASVRRAARAITLFRRLGYSDAKLDLVLNRYRRRAQVTELDVLRALSLSVKTTVRNDYKKMQRAFDEGALIGDVARSSGVAKDLSRLAALFEHGKIAAPAPLSAQKAPDQKRGLFGLLRRAKEAE